ncbi:probable rRNA-processing protein EBP2 [Gigantopelta aegis]|uniref:probable rRNA-processing protein EBP2 n=1 Tax=Gigantopelta aegis TaxID=1735272 RepID=UPI001B88B5C8|nr:probable rRNA-processing protein EBP2 [Gigantopelta aegis]
MSSDDESLDSDSGLQAAFSAGKLKPGLLVEAEPRKQFINNRDGLLHSVGILRQDLDWVERLDLTNDPAPVHRAQIEAEGNDVDDDFKREMKFYCQAQAAVLDGIPRLQKLGIVTKRPEDYFAQMAKSDDQMKKVREKLLEKKIGMERSEKAKKLRELRKYGKKVQHETLLKRQKEKRDMLDTVKKYRKGHMDKLDVLEDALGYKPKGQKQSQQNQNIRKHEPNKKRQYKNEKFGFGGQKKRAKKNTARSNADTSDFSVNVHQRLPGKKINSKKSSKGSFNKRLGKSKRQKFKNKNKKH